MLWPFQKERLLLKKSLAARALGKILCKNPVIILVPYHRIIRANETLTGYGGGLKHKAWLLEHEGLSL